MLRDFLFTLILFLFHSYTVIYVDALTVKLTQNVTTLQGNNLTSVACSYTMENVLKIDSISFLTLNDSSIGFESIISYLPDIKSLMTPRGQYLIGRVTLSNLTHSSTKAVMVFKMLLCIDYTLYKCSVRYIDSDGVGRETTSNTISLTRISAKVPPSAPDSISLMIISINSTLFTTEGDNVMYVCTGDVGIPPSNFIIQKFGHGNYLLVNYTAIHTSTQKFPENCSFYRTSYITYMVTAEDNQAVMRCGVVSTATERNKYIESEPLEVNYSVKMPTIVRHPNKTHYLVGSDTRIELTCTTNGNPEPSYLWYRDNHLEAISINTTFTFTDVATTNSGLYICEVSNTFNDVMNTKRVQIHVCIIKEGHKTPVNIIGNRGKVTKSFIVVSTVSGSMVLVLCAILFGVVQNKKQSLRMRNFNDRSLHYVNAIQQQDLSLYESVGHALDVHHYEQPSTGEHQYTNTNLSGSVGHALDVHHYEQPSTGEHQYTNTNLSGN